MDFEFEIAVNRPNIAKCYAVVNEAMNLLWNNEGCDGSWHFFGTSVIEKIKYNDGDSEVLHRVLNNKTICHS